MTKNKKTALISLIVGGVILSSAAIANFATSNGYNIYKESFRKLFDQTNYTMQMSAEVTVDDEPLVRAELIEQYDKASASYVNKQIAYDKTNTDRSQSIYEQYHQDGILITLSSPEYDGKGNYVENNAYFVHDLYHSNMPHPTFDKSTFDYNPEMFDKYFNFASSCLDLFVGDIKNNFVLTGTDNGLATYEANLDLFQIPEVVNAGADLIVSQVKQDIERRRQYGADYEEDFEDYIAKFVSDPFISSAYCTVTVDDEGRLVDNVLYAEISGKDENGDIHKMTVKLDIAFSDFGTTVPERIELDGKEFNCDSDNMKARIDELKIILANPELDENERKNYENELEHDTKLIAEFEKNGTVNIDALNKKEAAAQAEAAEVITEEASPVTENVEVTVTENEDASIGVIGGADGPTAVYVTR